MNKTKEIYKLSSREELILHINNRIIELENKLAKEKSPIKRKFIESTINSNKELLMNFNPRATLH
jgi:hypothetical protein